jgi:hypothetical protein
MHPLEKQASKIMKATRGIITIAKGINPRKALILSTSFNCFNERKKRLPVSFGAILLMP